MDIKDVLRELKESPRKETQEEISKEDESEKE